MEKTIKEFMEIHKRLKQKSEDFETTMWEMQRFLQNNGSQFRNTNFSFLGKIYEKFPEEKVLNCFGDIFYITENVNNIYICKRILWNLELSKERYCIFEDKTYDSDGDLEKVEYDIEIMID